MTHPALKRQQNKMKACAPRCKGSSRGYQNCMSGCLSGGLSALRVEDVNNLARVVIDDELEGFGFLSMIDFYDPKLYVGAGVGGAAGYFGADWALKQSWAPNALASRPKLTKFGTAAVLAIVGGVVGAKM